MKCRTVCYSMHFSEKWFTDDGNAAFILPGYNSQVEFYFKEI